MIPKVIHYCWFGGNPLPELAKKCIASWKKYCLNYDIIQWDESNFDVNCCDYVHEAYEAKMWAFVSDYARFKILYEYGGIYFDTDVELIRPIDDIVEKGSFMGLEFDMNIAPGLGLATTPGHTLIKEIINSYHTSHFIKNENGVYETVVERTTKVISRYGYIVPDEICKIAGVFIYPSEYFCPLNYDSGEINITENTRSIHHYMASWISLESKMIFSIKKNLCSKKGIRKLTGNVMILICRTIRKIRFAGISGCIRYAIKQLKS